MFSLRALVIALIVSISFAGKITERFDFEIENGIHVINNEGEYRMIAKDPFTWVILSFSTREERCDTCIEFTQMYESLANQFEDVYFAKFAVDKPGGMALGHRLESYETGFPSIRFINKEYAPGEIGISIHTADSESIEQTAESIKNLLQEHELTNGGYMKKSADNQVNL
mmetsp:Transcript_36334/g.46256  ORF Transcript_36334/g.46256 Transcript_36334/m.46256 type:complete len:170 (+) Transcript_36334:59-568(+)